MVVATDREACRRFIEPIVLFITASDRATVQSYAELRNLLRSTAFVPVHNEGATFMFHRKDFPPYAAHGVIHIPRPPLP